MIILIPKKICGILIVAEVGEVGNKEYDNAEEYNLGLFAKHLNTIPH